MTILQRLENARKAVLGVVSVVAAYGAIAFDVLGKSDLSTSDGVITAFFALAVGYGIWRIPNKPAP
jgi:hypothetical protein